MGQAIPNANGQIRPSTKHSDYPRCWSGERLASVLQEGRENANIDAGLGFIWRISVIASRMMVTQVPSSSSDEDGQRV